MTPKHGLRISLCILILLVSTNYALAQDDDIPDQIQFALEDLSRRVGTAVTLSDLSDYGADSHLYVDESLDCKLYNMRYSGENVPGFHFALEYEGSAYYYNVSEDGSVVKLCYSSADYIIPQAVTTVFQVLSNRLDTTVVPSDLIRSDYWYSSYVFTDTSMGCPLPDVAYVQTGTPGYMVKIDYGGTSYFYRVSQSGKHITSCATGTITNARDILWKLHAFVIDGEWFGVLEGFEPISLALYNDEITGYTGCNGYHADITLSGVDGIEVKGGGQTLMGCSYGIGEQESRLWDALYSVITYYIEDRWLVFASADGPVLIFEPYRPDF